MKSSFSSVISNRFSRNFGGTNAGVADPYLSGYFFISFGEGKNIFTSVANNIASDGVATISQTDIPSILQSCCTGVTPPGGTLNKVEYPGLGGIKWSVPGNIDYGTSVTLKFVEMQGLPIYHIIHNWFKVIRDYRFGATQLEEGENATGYTKSKYSTVLYYWTTAPDAKSVEYAACYDGVFPLKDPADLYSSDLETVGKVDVEIEFNVDYIWSENWVYNKCQNLSNAVNTVKNELTTRVYGSST